MTLLVLPAGVLLAHGAGPVVFPGSGVGRIRWGRARSPSRAQRTPGAVTADPRLGFELRHLNLNQETTMTKDRMALLELIEKRADTDLVREMLAFAAERLMELEVEAKTGVPAGARSPDRLKQRNGYRERAWDTRAGRIELAYARSWPRSSTG